MNSLYKAGSLLLIRAYSPLHIGVGRGYEVHVDLPIQRDEFGFPTIWSSSLKGAIKSNLDKAVAEYFGSEPGSETPTPSSVVVTDARLLLIPVRTLKTVWSYATSLHLLSYLDRYLESLNCNKFEIDENLIKVLEGGKAVVSKDELIDKNRVLINELSIEAEAKSDLLSTILMNLSKYPPPEDVSKLIQSKGLILLPDKGSLSLNVIRRSLMIQYRVRLSENKVVEEGPWSEEYIPTETVFVSTIYCRDHKNKNGESVCNEVISKIQKLKAIYVGGRETLGRGLVKIYIIKKDGVPVGK